MPGCSRVLRLSLALVTLLACGEEDVIVGSIASTAEGGSSPAFEGGSGQPCSNNEDCIPQAYCQKSSCAAPKGACELRPFEVCASELKTVCGCDGVVYWNDCLRMRDGVAASTAGECTGALPFAACGGPGNVSCPVADARCNHLSPSSGSGCVLPAAGVCWVLPEVCPAEAGVPEWHSCSVSATACTDLCTAINSGDAYQMSGPACQ
jgi:hypothetical protein